MTKEEFEKQFVNKIICRNCLDIMKDWPNNLVDLVFGSPPYEDARTYGIDFTLKGQTWVDWMFSVVVECLRVCRGLVVFVIEGKTKQFRYSATPILLMADLHRAGVHLRKPPIFHRVGIPGSGGPDWLRNDYEFILCCTNGGKLPWSDNIAMGHPPKWAPGGEMSYRLSDGTRRNQWGGTPGRIVGERRQDGSRQIAERPGHVVSTKQELRDGGMRRANGKRRKHGYTLPKNANPGNVIKCNVGGGQMGSKLAHENEAPFPERLAEFFIRSFCAPGGIVLDPFSGSGTTAAMAEKCGRNWIAIDVRQSQVDLSRRRIKEQKAGQGSLFH